MERDVYQPPRADLTIVEQQPIPAAITRKIRAGWIAATLSATVTLLLMLLSVQAPLYQNLFNIWSSIDVAIALLLAYGIYRRSRIAATLMLLYFVYSKIFFIVETGQFNGVLISAIFLYFYIHATIGTFQYHKFLKHS